MFTPSEDLIKALMSVTVFSRTEATALLELGEYQEIPSKTLLTKPNEIVNNSYLLIDGIVRHYILDNDEEITRNFIKGPHLLLPSVTDFFMRTKSSIYCSPISDIKVVRWSYTTLMDFSNKHINAYKSILLGFTNAFKKKEMREIFHSRRTAKERYENFLSDYPEIAHAVPLRYIASYLDIRPETLSRIRSKK